MEKPNEVNLSSNRKCAEVCHIKSPHNFWVRLEEYKNDYTNMLASLQSDYSNAHEDLSLTVKNLSLNSIYCTFNQKYFEWQRCEVLLINKNELFISYIDIGQTDLVPLQSVKLLKEKYQKINSFALHCSLNRVKPVEDGSGIWSSNSISLFSDLVMDKVVTLTFKSKIENKYNVELYLKTENITDKLIKEGAAQQDLNAKETDDSQKIQLDQFQTFKIDYSIDHDVNVTCIYSPFCFYAQLNQYASEFSELEQQLQEYYENALKQSNIILLTNPKIGQICIAKYREDQQWYRAIVKEVDNQLKNCRVFFIDYGNEDIVPIDHSLLNINDEFTKYPSMAIKCCLDGIRPLTEIFSSTILSQSVDFMYDSMTTRVLCTFLGKKLDNCQLVKINVELNKELIDLSKLLIDNSYVLSSESKPKRSTVIKESYVKNLVNEQVSSNNKLQSSNGVTGPSGDGQNVSTKFKAYLKNGPDLEICEKYEFLITYIETISEFYVKLNSPKNIEENRHLQNNIQYFYEKKVNLPQPAFETGNACIYYDFDKKEWYRAKILNVYDVHHCIIRLVDFGSIKYVNRASLREIYDKFLEPVCQVALASLDGFGDHEEIDERIQFKFKEIGLQRKFYGKVVQSLDQSESGDSSNKKRKYVLNLFDENGESVFSDIVHNLDNSINIASDTFKPRYRSKLEETRLDVSQNDETDFKQKPKSRPDKDILKDRTSPFPVHEENLKQQNKQNDFKTSNNAKSELPKSPSSGSITLIETSRQIDLVDKEKMVVTETIKTELFGSVNYYESIEFNLEYQKPISVNISFYESPNEFFAQINDLFLEFDSKFDDFQQSCSESTQIKLEELVKFDNLDRLALAAKFYDDNLWYRARVCHTIDFNKEHLNSNDDTKILIEFIDYGNCQMTAIKDCVYLHSDFSKYQRCAFKCNGLAYVNDKFELEPKVIENLLLYGELPTEQVSEEVIDKFNWDFAVFMTFNDKLLLQIDDLLKLIFKFNLIKAETYLDPSVYNENILQQENKTEITNLPINHILDAKLTSIEHGLKYIYFNLSSTLDKLKTLEEELEKELVDDLIKLPVDLLKPNQFFLIRLSERFYRSELITTKNRKNIYQFLLIDYGTRVMLNQSEVQVYKLMPKYFKQGSFSFHTRLTLADNIEKVWTREEKQKFLKQIQPGLTFKIKLITNSVEPYIIEFYDEQKSIDFQFNQIIARLGQTDSETQTLLLGSESISYRDEFYFAGNWLKRKIIEDTNKSYRLFISQNESLADHKQFKFYLQSERLLNQLDVFSKNFDLYAKQQFDANIKIKSLKKGDLFLSRTKSDQFLSNLEPKIKDIIKRHWSRVKIVNILMDKTSPIKHIHLFYIDYGLEDTVQYTEALQGDLTIYKFDNYDLIQLPLQFKIIPEFMYQCHLNKQDLARELINATKLNDFIDAVYLNDSFERMKSELAKYRVYVDFTQSLIQPEMNQTFYTADIYHQTSRSNLIDLIIKFSVENIRDYYFPCIISHINSVRDFYIQKEDTNNQDLLLQLQETIQNKVESGKLTKLKTVATNKLCISLYQEDGQYYRAKIISFGNGLLEGKSIDNYSEDLLLDVFFIDYGNTGQVKYNQVYEITPDLVDRLPRAFAINCNLELSFTLNDFELEEFNKFFFESFETTKFLARYKTRMADNKYHDSAGFYEVELYDSTTKKNLIDMLKTHLSKELNKSCVQMTQIDNKDLTDSMEDDKAIAETFNDSNNCDDTAFANNTTQVQDSFQVSSLPAPSAEKKPKEPELSSNKFSTTWETTALELKNYNNYDSSRTSSLQTPSPVQKLSDTWETTALELKNYNYNETLSVTINQTMNQSANLTAENNKDLEDSEKTLTEDQTLEKSELYSTANSDSVRFENLDQSIEKQTDSDEYITIKNSFVSFMHTPEDFFVQELTYEEELEKIQPEIDDCLDPYDSNESKYLVAQFEVDEQFYRCKLIKWLEDEGKAYVEFIDFGNREYVQIDTITKMNENLEKIKPLAINCTLGFSLKPDSVAYKQFEQLVNTETEFNIKVKRADLDEFYAKQEKACKVELKVSSTGVNITKETLEDPKIWSSDLKRDKSTLEDDLNKYYVMNIKQEPVTVAETTCQVEANKSTKRKDHDDDHDQRNNGFEPNSNNFKTSTQINLNGNTSNNQTSSTNSQQHQNGRKADCGPDDTDLDEDSDDMIDDKDIMKIISEEQQNNADEKHEKISSKPEAYFYVPTTKSEDQNKSNDESNNTSNDYISKTLDEKNESTWLPEDQKKLDVSHLDDKDSNRTANKSQLDETSINKNADASRFPDEHSIWTKEKTILDETNLNKNADASRFPDEASLWSGNNSALNESNVNKNADASRFPDEASIWSKEKTILNETNSNKNADTSHLPDEASVCSGNNSTLNESNVNKNADVSRFPDEASIWSKEKTILDETNLNKNADASRFPDEASIWSKENTILNETNFNKNADTSHFPDEASRWTANNTTLDVTNGNKNDDASRFADEDSKWTVNNTIDQTNLDGSSNDYLCQTIIQNNMSVWSQDPDQSGFDIRKRSKTVKSNLDITKLEDKPEYIRILTGSIIHVNSLDNFYFQAEDADIELMNMKKLVDKCEKRFERLPTVNQLCVAKYRADNQFYRAQILEIVGQNLNTSLKQDPKLKVLYIDYGNMDYINLSDIFKINSDLKYIQPLAMKCSLGFTKKLENLIKKLNDENKDSSELITYFKSLTGKSKATIKVRKQTQANPVNLVDVFIKDENICDLLVAEALTCLTNPSVETGPLSKIKIKPDHKEFECYLLNFKKFSLDIKLRNESILKMIDEYIENFNNETIVEVEKEEIYCLAPLNKALIEKYKLNNSFGRVFIKEKKLFEKENMAKVKFIDFDYECWINLNDLVRTSRFMSQIQPGVENFQLNIKNSSKLSELSAEQLDQLSEIFKLLINYEPESSSKLKAKLVNKSVRLYDPERENLDITRIIEMVIALMTNPFIGKITHLENDYSQFDCLNEIASHQAYKVEMNKLFRSTELFDYNDGIASVTKIGQLCLVDQTVSSKPVVHHSASILSLAEHVIDNQDDVIEEPNNRDLFRGIIMDETIEKCVVLDVDSGRHLTITKRRLRPLNSSQSCRLIELIPFMLIKAKIPSQSSIKQIQQLLHKSRYYGDLIKLQSLSTYGSSALNKIVQVISESSSNVSVGERIETELNKDPNYKLSFARSLNCFYIHSIDSHKQLKFIEDQIKIESSSHLNQINSKNPPDENHIYAVHSPKENKFYRIRLSGHYVSTPADDEIYQAFYIDYGYVKKVRLNDLIQISEQTQLIAPQAICCKLYGFQTSRSEFEDAEATSSDIENSLNENYFELFKKILTQSSAPFYATIYKQYSIKESIINFVPLQSDNTKPIEIVIHLFDSQKHGHGPDLTLLLKKDIKLETPASKSLKRSNLTMGAEYDVDIVDIQTPNEFYLILKKNKTSFNELSEQLSQSCSKLLEEKDIKKGALCAYIKRDTGVLKRALITEYCYVKSQLNIRIYLIDFGSFIYCGLSDLYEIPEIFYDFEPYCFKSSLNLKLDDEEIEKSVSQRFKSLLNSCKFYRIKIEGVVVNHFNLNDYIVQLAGSKSADPNRQYNFNFNSELDSIIKQLLNEKIVWGYEEKTTIFNETKLPLNQLVKCQLTNVDTAKHFGLVLSLQNEKRYQFLSKFHQWHKENKKNLNLLITGQCDVQKIVGSACAVSSIQISKWCRGLVVHCDLTAQMSNVYLIDYCRTITITNDRLYKLENEEFLNEPTFVHRCQLQDDQNQLEHFSKYIDLIKSNSNPTANLLTPNNGVDRNNDTLNSSHISIENFEVFVECLGKELIPLQSNSQAIKNYQYTIKVIEIKRIKSPFPNSPYSILNNTSKIKITPQQVNKYDSFYDETTENILCSTYKENFNEHNSNQQVIVTSYTSAHVTHPRTTLNSENTYENDYQNDTFSAITESTRIQTIHDDTNTNGDSTLCESNTIRNRRSTDPREETSNWIKDLDENDDSKLLISKSGLKPGDSPIRVRVLPTGFSPNGFYCQRLDLLNLYERLKGSMNDYYQKITNASKSLERDKSDPRYNSLRSDFADSLDEDKSIDNDLFTQSFHCNDYCAAYFGKSWVRCIILDIDNKVAHVECVDDGRTQHIPLNKLEKLNDNFQGMERFCFKCKFAGLDSKKLLGLDLKAIENFEKYLCDNDREFLAEIISSKVDESGQEIHEINLFMNKENVINLWQKS